MDADFWSPKEVAEYLGVKPQTVHRYRVRSDDLRKRQAAGEEVTPTQLAGALPMEDQMMGRTPVWRPETIVEWKKRRRGRGVGGGRPRKKPAEG